MCNKINAAIYFIAHKTTQLVSDRKRHRETFGTDE